MVQRTRLNITLDMGCLSCFSSVYNTGTHVHCAGYIQTQGVGLVTTDIKEFSPTNSCNIINQEI